MTADLLREAAAKIREDDHAEFCLSCGVERGQSHARGDCTFPAFMPAVADWLDRLHGFLTGDEYDQDTELLDALDGEPDAPPLSDWPEVESALAVARAYLGRDS